MRIHVKKTNRSQSGVLSCCSFFWPVPCGACRWNLVGHRLAFSCARHRLGRDIRAARHACGGPAELHPVHVGVRLQRDLSGELPSRGGSERLGDIIDTAVAFQFDKDSDYNASTKASGRLVLIAGGVTTAGSTRTYHVYFHGGSGSFQPAQVTPKVVLTDNITDAGQLSYRIQATGSTYYYHKQGAGFSSWIDANGNDWLSYAAGGGSAGEYRGIPNAVYPEGHFHPGKTSATSDIVSTGPVKATIHSITTDGKWECRWEIYPRFARMTMLKKDHGYWFLYEGTPGGAIQPATDFMVRSDGTQTALSTSWTADLGTNEWAYFSDPNVVTGGRSLFMVHDEDDAALDSYWTMENNMTVFGFGRNNAPTEALINAVPQHLTIGLMDGTQFTQCSKIINGAYRPMTVAAGSPGTATGAGAAGAVAGTWCDRPA